METTPSTMTLAYATAILALFMWLCGTITTYVRGRALESPNREDGAVMNFFNRVFFVPTGDLTVLPDNSEKHAAVNRWSRITSNNTANIPAALLVFLVAAQLESLEQSLLIALIWIFVAARFVHTFCYALAIQPFRTAFYSIGSTCMMIAAISILVI
jgi:uncharacterized membrane protein YecN with MAPEG domain/predicted N-acetyltransferase YhbS